jgi:hypothetical protein
MSKDPLHDSDLEQLRTLFQDVQQERVALHRWREKHV